MYLKKLWLKMSQTKEGSMEGPKQMNSNRPTPRASICKMAKVKDKERVLKVERERVIYKDTSIGLSTDFSAETLQAGRELQESIQNPER